MNCPFNEEQLLQLNAFTELCKTQPQVLQHPKLSFFKDYLVSLGVTLPAATFGTRNFAPSGDNNSSNTTAEEKADPSSEENSETESDVELDMEGILEPDVLDDSQVMGDATKAVTEEDSDKSDEKRSEAMKAFSEQKYDEAIKLYTEAIQLNPQSALLFAKRGQVYLKLNKMNACIKDCSQALELNCDSAAAYKFRGRAYRLLGKFEEASQDLCESLKIDYDDQTNEWLSEVKPNAEKLRQHKLTAQRKKEEKEHREKLRRLHKQQEARARAAQEQSENQASSGAGGFTGGAGGFPGGFGGFPAGGGGMNASDIANFLNDPEIKKSFEDQEVFNALIDVSMNPANLHKYQNNPKIVSALEKLKSKLANAGGADGAPGAGTKSAADDDVGLD